MNLRSGVVISLIVALSAGCAEFTPTSSGVKSLEPSNAAILVADPAVVVVDVRSAEAYSAAHLARAVSIPRRQLWLRASEVPATPAISVLVYDEDGHYAHGAAMLIQDETGHEIFVLAGGMRAWQLAGLPVSGRKAPAYALK
jgi:rhodanese-related sulfurtransferase